jgi:hypothetical protein
VIARGGEVAFDDALLGLLDLESIDERHHAHALRGSRFVAEHVRAAEPIEHVQRPLDLGGGVAREAARAHAPPGEDVLRTAHAHAAQHPNRRCYRNVMKNLPARHHGFDRRVLTRT